MSDAATATRRRFLEASAGAAVTTWLASLAHAGAPGGAGPEHGERLLQTLPFVGEGSFPLGATVGDGLGRRRALDLSTLSSKTLLTPRDEFFIRTGCPDGLPPATSWKVRVHGLVGKPAEIEVAEVRREATDRGAHLLECAGNSRGAHFGFMGVARWTGVPLERVLERVAPLSRATQVLVSGFDEHSTRDAGSVPGASWIFRLDQVRDAGAFLATEMNGAPLAPDHGYPLRLVVPGWYGCTAIKWVNEIALVDDDAPATAQMREFAGRTHQEAGPRDELLIRAGQRPEGPPLARDFQPATIDPAAVAVRVERLRASGGRIGYRVVGIAWGGRTPARGLLIRLNPQPSELPVERIEFASGVPWTLCSFTYPSLPPGPHRIELVVGDPAVRTRRLDMRFYAREFEIPSSGTPT